MSFEEFGHKVCHRPTTALRVSFEEGVKMGIRLQNLGCRVSDKERVGDRLLGVSHPENQELQSALGKKYGYIEIADLVRNREFPLELLMSEAIGKESGLPPFVTGITYLAGNGLGRCLQGIANGAQFLQDKLFPNLSE